MPVDPAPDWDLEQIEVILEDAAAWQVVEAGPGAGKTAVACQRIASLVDDGVTASRILLVSFTRTAVAELRDRIVLYAHSEHDAASVRISTIDSQAWRLRYGFEEEPLPKSLTDGSYDLNIRTALELFEGHQPDLADYMAKFEHVLVDEAQDVVGVRAKLIIELLRSLSESCGVTILADPAQAIYGFTTEESNGNDSAASSSLLELLPEAFPDRFVHRKLTGNHRVRSDQLLDTFLRTRQEVENSEDAASYIARIQQTIKETSGRDVGTKSYENITDFVREHSDASTLVLFRRRADVLLASSYCSNAGLEHRLRMSNMPLVARPWIGWLFEEYTAPLINRDEFDELWSARARLENAPFAGEQKDECWHGLHSLAAGFRPNSVDLVQLRRLLARSRPPVEFCEPEVGRCGPILGTIHASKGREGETVVLVMPSTNGASDGSFNSTDKAVLEEGRVYYVGATRARSMLITARSTKATFGYLDSKRAFRYIGKRRVQLEVGRDGDVASLAHLSWSNSQEIQRVLASRVGQVTKAELRTDPEANYAMRIKLELQGADQVLRYPEVAQMSELFERDLRGLWGRIDSASNLRPCYSIPYVYMVAVTTIALHESELDAVGAPFNQSGIALAPIVKGLAPVTFCFRSHRGGR